MSDSLSGIAGGPAAHRRQLSRFVIVGLLCVATDGVVYAVAGRCGLSQDLAKGVGYLAGMALGFVLNKAWTFGSRRAAGSEAATYVALYAITLLVNIGLNHATLTVIAGRLVPSAAAALAFLVATGVTTVLNYLGMRYITFRRGIAELGAQP